MKESKIIKYIVDEYSSSVIEKLLDAEEINIGLIGDLYISNIRSDTTTDWKKHKKQQSRLKVIEGNVCFEFLKDDKSWSYKINSFDKCFVAIPPGTWYRFTSITPTSKILSFPDMKHSEKDIVRRKV